MSSTQDETLIIIPEWSDGPANNSPDQTDRQSLSEIAMNPDRSWTRKILLPGFSEPQIISDITHHVFHIPLNPERHSMLFWGRAQYMAFTHQSLTIDFPCQHHEIAFVIPRAILDLNRWSRKFLFNRLLMFCGQIEENNDPQPFVLPEYKKQYRWRVKIEHWGQVTLISPNNAGTTLEKFQEHWNSCPEPDEGMLTQASYEVEMKELTWASDPESEHNQSLRKFEENITQLEASIEADNRKRQECRQRIQRSSQIIKDLIAQRSKISTPQTIAHNAAQGSGKKAEPTAYQILDSTRRKNPVNLCFASDKPLKDVKHMIYYILYVGSTLHSEAIARQDYVIGTSEEPLGESVCYLLNEFYGCTLMAPQDFAIPIDMYDLWNCSRSDPDLDKRNGLWIGRTRRKPLPGDWFDIIEKKCFVPSLAERMTQILRGDIVPYKMGGFPWSDPTSNVDDLVLAMQGEQDKGLSLDLQEQPQDKPLVEELEQSYSAPDATYLNHDDMGGIGVVMIEDTEITCTEVDEQRITAEQLKFELDKAIEKADTLDSWTPEYEANDKYREALIEVIHAKNFEASLDKEPHPDSEFYRDIWEVVEKHGDGDYGMTDLEIDGGYTLRSNSTGGRIFQEGESITSFESPYSNYGVGGPLEVKGGVTADQKEHILGQIKGLDKDLGGDDNDPGDPIFDLTKEDKHNIYEQAIDFFLVGTEESEDFYISQKIPGDPSKGIPSLEIQQVADRITINELTPDGFFQICASHQEHPQKGWMPDPETNLNLNNLGRILSILGGKVNLATGADMPLTEEVATDKATKVPPPPNTFWITHECSYLKSRMTCVKTMKTLAQARLDAYYILSEGYGAFDENDELSDIEPSQESVCHLLIKYFGYEICEYGDSATEIDLYDLWNWTQDDIHPTNKSWYKWLELSRFRWGFYSELMAVMDGSLNVDRLPQYPWSSQHESVTGWDCGEYIIEIPFNLFNSKSEAEEFGHSCLALQTNEKYPSLFRLLYGDGDQACLRKNDVVVYRKPSMSYEVNPDDRDAWEVTDLSAEDIPGLEISGPLYCQGRDTKGVEV